MDELNTIYVSLTRAKNELYIFIPQGIERTNNIAGLLIPPECFERGSPQIYKNGPSLDASSLLIEPPEYKDYNILLKEEFGDFNTIKNREKLLQGRILHEILASVGNLAQEDRGEQIKKGLAKARVLFPFVEDFSGPEAIIRKFLQQEAAKKFFYLADGKVFQEKDVIDCFGATKRIDRFIVKEKEAWIVDYKSKADQASSYKEQLDAYKRIVKEIFPDKAVKCFIISLEDSKIEEING